MRRTAWPLMLLALSLGVLGPASLLIADDPDPPAINPPAFVSDPTRPAVDTAGFQPIYMLQDGPIDWESLRQRIARPDLVVLDGPEYQDLLQRAEGNQPGALSPPAHVVEAVEVSGRVVDERASLIVALQVRLSASRAVWVPVRLDGLVPGEVREGSRALPLRLDANGSWEVELTGEGLHRFEVQVPLIVRAEPDGRRLELRVPPSAATRLDLSFASRLTEAYAGPREPLSINDDPDEGRSRIVASLSPRDLISIRWQVTADPAGSAPPVLSTQGEIALSVDRGSLFSRSTWLIRSDRGQARKLTLLMEDSTEQLLTVELNEQPLPIEGLRDPETGQITITLEEPLQPGAEQPLRLSLTSRRMLPAGATTRIGVSGYPLVHALAQSGVVAIVQGNDLWVSGTPRRGVRQMDPVTELPEGLRVRPKTVLAYQFIEQPFELELRVDPSPPVSRVAARTSLMIEPGRLTNRTEFDYHVTRGRVFDLDLDIPAGLDLVRVGPPDLVASYRSLDSGTGGGNRYVQVRLTPKALDSGSFKILLEGTQPIDARQPFQAQFFRPRSASSQGGVIAVSTSRSVSIDSGEIAANSAEGSPFVPLEEGSPADWTWPGAAPFSLPALWLRYDRLADSLPLRASVRPLQLNYDTSLAATLDRSQLNLIQATTCYVRNGSLASLDILVPNLLEATPGRWGTEGAEVVSRTLLGADSQGGSRYRLTLAREVIDSLELRFWARLPIEPGLSSDEPRTLTLPVIRFLEGASASLKAEVRCEPFITLDSLEPGWTRPAAVLGDPTRDQAAHVQLTWTADDPTASPPPFRAQAPALAPLPGLIVRKLWLRTLRNPEGAYQQEVWFRLEAHGSSLQFLLPPEARPLKVQVGDEPAELERLDAVNTYLIRLPASQSGPLLVGLVYTLPASGPLEPSAPVLPDDAIIQETLWEYRIPWTQAIAGTPPGWTDENQWYWAGYVWKRRPVLDTQQLSDWLKGNGLRPSISQFAPEDQRLGYHGYLFGRPGPPAEFRPALYSRALLVGICSGVVLALGVILLSLRPNTRLVALGVLGSALALAIALDPSLSLLVIQSSLFGVALTLIAALTQTAVQRRLSTGPIVIEPATADGFAVNRVQPERDSSRNAPLREVGSDESTVIRPRATTTPTTIDYKPPSEPREFRESFPRT